MSDMEENVTTRSITNKQEIILLRQVNQQGTSGKKQNDKMFNTAYFKGLFEKKGMWHRLNSELEKLV